MSGLEEVGVPGPDHLREALTNCTDPLAAIEEFQARITFLCQTSHSLGHRTSHPQTKGKTKEMYCYDIVILGGPGEVHVTCLRTYLRSGLKAGPARY